MRPLAVVSKPPLPAQTHTSTVVLPRAEAAASEQSVPKNPGWQWHQLRTHSPRPEQPLMHACLQAQTEGGSSE